MEALELARIDLHDAEALEAGPPSETSQIKVPA